MPEQKKKTSADPNDWQTVSKDELSTMAFADPGDWENVTDWENATPSPLPPGPPQPNFGKNLVRSGVDFATGLVKGAQGIASLGFPNSVVTLAKAAQGDPEAKAKVDAVLHAPMAVANHYKERYGGMENIGRTAYEDPVGFLADVSVLSSGVGAAAKIPAAAKFPAAVKAGEMASKIGLATDPIAAPLALATKAIPAGVPERLYQSALKPTPKGFRKVEPTTGERKLIATGLREGIPVSGGGYAKTDKLVDALEQSTEEALKAGKQAGETIDPVAVARRVDPLLSKNSPFQTVDPASDLSAIEGVKSRFLENHTPPVPPAPVIVGPNGKPFPPPPPPPPTPIPIEEAQAIKRNTYRQLKDKYGKQGAAATEAEKAIARGLKEEIINLHPELRQAGERQGALIELQDELERYLRRHGNREIVSLGLPMTISAGAELAGGKGAVIAGLMKKVIEEPWFKSWSAIWLNRARKSNVSSSPAVRAMTPLAVAGERTK